MATSVVATHNLNGRVATATTRSFKSKAGKTFTKTVLTTDSGVEFELDSLGDKTGTYPTGREVSFGVAQVFGKWQVAGPTVLGLPYVDTATATSPGVASTMSTPKATSSQPRGGFPIKGDDYQVSIIRQNSLTNAVNTVVPLLMKTLPTDGGGAGLQRFVDEMSDLVIRLAYKYASFSSGNLDTQVLASVANKALGADSKE